MLNFLLIISGKTLAALPLAIPRTLCTVLGSALFRFYPKRRYSILSNLHHAFPEKSQQWRERIGKTSCQRMVEMALFNLASPYISIERHKQHFKFTDDYLELALKSIQDKQALIFLIPHLSLMEALAISPSMVDFEIPETGVIYRSLGNKALENSIKKSREKFGVKLLARRQGFLAANHILKNKGWVSILFDQNSGKQGLLTTSLDRLVSSTELPSIFAEHHDAIPVPLYVERTGFWSGTYHIGKINYKKEAPITLVFAINQWLDRLLKSSDRFCQDWLWAHNRWRNQDDDNNRFRILAKRNGLEETKAYFGWKTLPRKTRFWIRLPNWLGDVMMALPLIRALRIGRPDAEITLLAQPQFVPLLKAFNLAETIIALPSKKKLNYFSPFKKLKHQYPDTHILLTNSMRGDLEAKYIGAPQRFSMERPGKPRKQLTHTWKLPSDLDETKIHQTYVWEKMFRYFGLEEALDLSPLALSDSIKKEPPIAGHIALFCGSENAPQKRWPIEHWKRVIHLLSKENSSYEFYLLGTPRDKELTAAISKDMQDAKVIDQAGKTTLAELVTHLTRCQLAIGNDSGGMHIANAIGTPLVAIYGPTNPVRTGPIFQAPFKVVQPPGCPATGGAAIADVSPESIVAAVNELV